MLLLGVLSYLAYAILFACSGAGTAHSGLGPPMSIISQETIPQACLQANLTKAFLSIEFFSIPSPQMMLACIKSNKTLNSVRKLG